jgi:hypothetical protein
LAEIAKTGNAAGLHFGGGERGQEERGEHSDYGDDDQKFDQGETPFHFHEQSLPSKWFLR